MRRKDFSERALLGRKHLFNPVYYLRVLRVAAFRRVSRFTADAGQGQELCRALDVEDSVCEKHTNSEEDDEEVTEEG